MESKKGVVNNSYKKLILLTIAVTALLAFCSCGSSKNTQLSDLSSDYISDYLKTNVVFKDNLQKIDDNDLLKNLYSQIDLNYISEYSVYVSASGATAEEIAVFKLKDNIYSDDINKIVADRVQKQVSNFENYVPEEVYKLNNSIVDYNNDRNMFVYVSCDTPDDVEILLKKIYTS